MDAILAGLLADLERRCRAIKGQLATAQAQNARYQSDLAAHALAAYRSVESVRREAVRLLADPSFGVAALIPNHLRDYRRWNEQVTLVEIYPLRFIERYNANDAKLTRLCEALTRHLRWPLPAPVVSAFSESYYWIAPEYNIIAVPATAATSCLDWPDLLHELGHVLSLVHQPILIGGFLGALRRYVAGLRREDRRQQRPPGSPRFYDELQIAWQDRWMEEFLADAVATFLVGPAFGWQHLRLCAADPRRLFHDELGPSATHPADEPRLRGILAVLDLLGGSAASAALRRSWGAFLTVQAETPGPEQQRLYPDQLLVALVGEVVAGCQQLGLRPYTQAATTQGDIVGLLQAGWDRFLADPRQYPLWEEQALAALWVDLGF